MTEMEKLSQKESLLLGSSQRALSRSCSSSRTPYRDSDVDFHDVFGGPPRRRSSIHDVGYDSNDSKNSVESKGDDEPLFGLSNEKPVFGDETLNRRRYPSNDFFDDIFRVNEGVSSTPRKLERDPFSSVPGSRVLSPARPLQPLKVENFAQLRLSKGMDFPTFGSAPCSPYKDIASTGISYSPGVVLSRFSNNGNEDLGGNDVRPSYCQSPQSQEFSLSREGSSELTKSGKGGLGSNSKRESDTSENSANNSPFHFSIYKWASKGVPLEMPLREVYSSRLKGGVKAEQLSRTDGCKDKENKGTESQPITTGLMSSRFEQDKPEVDLLLYEITPDKAKPCEIVEKVNFLVPESEMFQSFQNPIKDVADNTILSHISEDMKSPCLSEKPEKEIKQARRYGLKPLRSLFFDNDLREGSKSGTAKTGYQKESVAKNTKNLSIVADSRRNVEKWCGKRASAASSDIDKLSCPSSPMNSKDSQGRNKVKGKVKEFVKMFNQETSSKIKDAVSLQSQSSTSKGDGVTNDDISKAQTPKLTQQPDASKMGDEDPKKSLKEPASMKTASYFFNNSFGNDSSAFNTGSFRKASRSIAVETDDSFLGDFQIKELPQDETEQSLAIKDGEEIEAIDAKIQKWKKGKEGNIRSLLSTLHYVLWAESGWKAVPLIDIIEGNAVKRAYQKALLCLHPDKLQQKGAAPHQKYLAEKVFDTLQESWDYFNSIDRL